MAAVAVPDDLECYLWAILSDPSGLDQAEFLVTDETTDDGCFRAWPFQWAWWRNSSAKQIEMGSRSSGKSLSVRFRALAFPFLHAGQEMVVTAPEGNHLDALTDNIENVFVNNRLPAEMLTHGRNGIKHRPFHMNFKNGARIMGRIPQRDGKGIKGCDVGHTPILTDKGLVRADEIQLGDMVMTHEGRWCPVERVDVDVNDCYEVQGIGSWPLTVSCDHRFLGASDWSKSPGKTKRDFSGGLYFSDVEKLIEDNVYWATPTEFPHVDVPYPDTDRFEPEDVNFWWLVGLYLADGYVAGDSKTCWVTHPNKADQRLMAALGHLGIQNYRTVRNHSSADVVTACNKAMKQWLDDHFGHGAESKRLPAFVLSMKEDFRQALLDGYLAGDGCWVQSRNRWQIGTASESLAVGLQLLAQSLGLKCSCHHVVQPKVTHVMGVELKSKPLPSYRFSIYASGHGRAAEVDGYYLGKVKKVVPVGKQQVYNIIVEEDHSHLSGSIMSHNIHPIWLELDEGQDYPEAGWLEIIETVKRGEKQAQWRAHGVTRGIRDKFYEYTQPDSGWEVHHYPAMYRPTWDEDERKEKVQLYGHKDSPDYRRNVLGLHGDAQSPLFVLHRLMECFPGDTLVATTAGEKLIKDVKVADVVFNALGTGEVLAVNQTERDVILKVTLTDGQVVHCTPEHPFFTNRGWVHADKLTDQDVIFTREEIVRMVRSGGDSPEEQEVLLPTLYADVARADLPWLTDKEENGEGV